MLPAWRPPGEEGAQNPDRGASTYYLAIFFTKNCMKMKEIGPRGGIGPLSPPMH